MDDNRFDDIIKRKVSEYEDPTFDPSSLSAFHNRVATLSYAPWYSRYRRELLIGSGIALSTLFIISSIWFMNQQASEGLEKNQLYIKTQQEEIIKLKQEISYLKNLPQDTVHIIQFKEQPSSATEYVIHRIEELESTIHRMKEIYGIKSSHQKEFSTAIDSANSSQWTNTFNQQYTLRLRPDENRKQSLRAEPRVSPLNKHASGSFSAKTVRELEKHYHKGMGIRLGPTLELSKGLYRQGAGGIDISGGLLGDFILSPSLSIETGVKFNHRFYEIREEDIVSINSKLPYVNTDLAPLTGADVDSWMVEVPVNLKYRYPLSTTSHGLVGFGYSSVVYTKQILEYSYNHDAVPSGYITEPHTVSKITGTAGTLNVSLGLSKRLKNNKILETSIYYQHGLGEPGVEKMKSNYVGIRGAYWFTVR